MATIKKACKGGLYPKASNVSSRLGSLKKAQSGTSLGMKSVKAGYDKNPGVTRADIIIAAKKKAKGGAKVMKKALFGIGLSKEERQAKREERQLRRRCKGGLCGGRAKGFVGYKKGGSVKKTMKAGGKMTKKCKYGCK